MQEAQDAGDYQEMIVTILGALPSIKHKLSAQYIGYMKPYKIKALKCQQGYTVSGQHGRSS